MANTVKWYKRKQDAVRAIMWDGTNFNEMIGFIGVNLRLCWSWGIVSISQINDVYGDILDIKVGDYIIEGSRGTKSRFFRMEKKRFEAIYEEVTI